MYVNLMCACCLQRPRGCQIPWNWCYRLCGAIVYLLGSEPRSSVRVANALKKPGVPLFLWLFLSKIFIFNCIYVCIC